MKRCKRCGQIRPYDEFHLVKPGKYSSRCRDCHGIEWRSCKICGTQYEGLAGKLVCSASCRQRLRPPTYKTCEQCQKQYGPVDRLNRRFCSLECKFKAQATGRKRLRKTITKARNAQSLLRYHVQAGHITRPACCEQCGGSSGRIEGSHTDYDKPLSVRWLCVSCHRRLDKANPKNVTYVVMQPTTAIAEVLTGDSSTTVKAHRVPANPAIADTNATDQPTT